MTSECALKFTNRTKYNTTVVPTFPGVSSIVLVWRLPLTSRRSWVCYTLKLHNSRQSVLDSDEQVCPLGPRRSKEILASSVNGTLALFHWVWMWENTVGRVLWQLWRKKLLNAKPSWMSNAQKEMGPANRIEPWVMLSWSPPILVCLCLFVFSFDVEFCVFLVNYKINLGRMSCHCNHPKW